MPPDSGGASTGFRCASGEHSNADRRELAIEGLDASAEGMSPDKLQQVIAEGGVEALTRYLADMGQTNAKVLTPEELRKRQQAGARIVEEGGGNAEEANGGGGSGGEL